MVDFVFSQYWVEGAMWDDSDFIRDLGYNSTFCGREMHLISSLGFYPLSLPSLELKTRG